MVSNQLCTLVPATVPQEKLELLGMFSLSILPDTVGELAGRKKASLMPIYFAVCKTHYNSRLNWQPLPLITCSHLKHPEKPYN